MSLSLDLARPVIPARRVGTDERAHRSRERKDAAVPVVLAWLRTPGRSLDDLVRDLGPALGAVGVGLAVGDEHHTWGDLSGARTVEVVYAGRRQGTLSLAPDVLAPDAALVGALGPVLAAARLEQETEVLRRAGDAAARELADARWRAAADMERERRGLERNLHDGAQHHLVGLRMSVAVLEHLLSVGDLAGARVRIAELPARLDAAQELLVRTAAGLLPRTLVDQGLAAALVEQLAAHDDVTLDVPYRLGRRPTSVESAVYFVCLEAVNNTHKHAPGARILVTVRDTGPGLEFAVVDDGPGFAEPLAGTGLPDLRARIGAVGGRLTIHSVPGQGTMVAGWVGG